MWRLHLKKNITLFSCFFFLFYWLLVTQPEREQPRNEHQHNYYSLQENESGKQTINDKPRKGEAYKKHQEGIRQMKNRLPSTLVVGEKNCGIDNLEILLTGHPQIKIASKLSGFFLEDHHYNKGLEWYRLMMPETSEDESCVDVLPGILSNETLISRVQISLPHAKFVWMVCDPLTKLQLDYQEMRMKSKSSIIPVIHSSVFGHAYVNRNWKQIQGAYYDEQYKRLSANNTSDRILLVENEALQSDPLTQLQRIVSFLELETYKSDYLIPRLTKKSSYLYCTMQGRCTINYTLLHGFSEKILSLFRKHLIPHVQQFSQAVGIRFSWSDKYKDILS